MVQIRLQDLTRLGSLHYLYLQNNSISALEPGAFLSQGQLLELALNGNLIHLVTPDVFRGLEHLRILYLAGNQITRVQDHTFRGLQVGWSGSSGWMCLKPPVVWQLETLNLQTSEQLCFMGCFFSPVILSVRAAQSKEDIGSSPSIRAIWLASLCVKTQMDQKSAG